MASTQISPGVVVLERDLTNSVNATVDNVAAVVGTFEKGPVEEVRVISNEKQLIEEFGKPNDYNYEYWFSAAQFLLYGGSVKVVRAANDTLKNAIDTAQITLATFAATDTTLTVSDATDVDVNDLLKINDEIMKVTAVSGVDLTVDRAQLATTAVLHPASSQIMLIEPSTSSPISNSGVTITDSATSIPVTSAATLGATVNGYVRIDDEILQVTAINGNTLTVTRAVLGTAAAAHTDGVDVTRQIVTADKTTINETTTTGVAAPLIKNLDEYEAVTESAANNWKWAARSPGTYGNSLRVVMTDAGPDQMLFMGSPSTGSEHKFTTGKRVVVSATNSRATIYNYVIELTLEAGSTLKGDFAAGAQFVAGSGAGNSYTTDIAGDILAYNAKTRTLQVSIDYDNTTDYFKLNDKIQEKVSGSATGDEAIITAVKRKLMVVLDPGATAFTANQDLFDSSTLSGEENAGVTVNIDSISGEYESREYDLNQKWSSIARRPGTSSYAADRGGHHDLMHILVIDGDGGITGVPGSVLEKFLDVSKASDARSPQGANIYYKDVIKAQSKYLFWGSHEATLAQDLDGTSVDSIGGSATNRHFDPFKSSDAIVSKDGAGVAVLGTKNASTVKYSLKGGVDGYTAQRDKLFDSYDMFSDPETEEVDYILMGPAMSNDIDSQAKAQKCIDIAATRKDCMAFISPPRDSVIGVSNNNDIVEKTIEFFDGLSSSSYAVFDNNYKYIYDKYNDKYRYLPCNADVAGLTLSTALNQEPWFSPAGFTRGQLRNAVKLAYSPLKDQRDRLYASRVNPIVAFPGQGIVLFGDKTALSTASAFDRINVRRLFLVIEKAIATAAKSQLFELNDEFTRQGFKNVVDPYLRGVQSRRGVVDYLVVCDRSNNPDDAIDRGEFFAEIFVKPTRSINFITLQFTATRTGASFSEIVS